MKEERKLTDEEIERQDFVDNRIFEVMNSFLPPDKTFEWDIGAISNIRDSIGHELTRRGLISEEDFYPFLESPSCKHCED